MRAIINYIIILLLNSCNIFEYTGSVKFCAYAVVF